MRFCALVGFGLQRAAGPMVVEEVISRYCCFMRIVHMDERDAVRDFMRE